MCQDWKLFGTLEKKNNIQLINFDRKLQKFTKGNKNFLLQKALILEYCNAMYTVHENSPNSPTAYSTSCTRYSKYCGILSFIFRLFIYYILSILRKKVKGTKNWISWQVYNRKWFRIEKVCRYMYLWLRWRFDRYEGIRTLIRKKAARAVWNDCIINRALASHSICFELNKVLEVRSRTRLLK